MSLVNSPINVVPLEDVLGDKCIRKGAYYISKDGKVWSVIASSRTVGLYDTVNCFSTSGVELCGTYTPAGDNVLTFSISTGGFLDVSPIRTSYTRDKILRMLNAYWASNWANTSNQTLKVNEVKPEVVTAVQPLGKIKKAWIIGSVKPSGNYVFTPNPVEYDSLNKANTAAERLAEGNPGVRYQVFETLGSVIACGLKWN